jgi:hypothetical protein
VERVDDRREMMVLMGAVASDHVWDGAPAGASRQPIQMHQTSRDFRTAQPSARSATTGDDLRR